jgi:hypothetical protein
MKMIEKRFQLLVSIAEILYIELTSGMRQLKSTVLLEEG